MNTVLVTAALCICATVLCRMMDKYNKEYAVYISVAVCCGVLATLIAAAKPLIEAAESFFFAADADSGSIRILFKCVGVCYLTGFARDICADSGENAMASQASLAGRITVMLIALPMLKDVLMMVNRLISL